jgi:hypothetical protein
MHSRLDEHTLALHLGSRSLLLQAILEARLQVTVCLFPLKLRNIKNISGCIGVYDFD